MRPRFWSIVVAAALVSAFGPQTPGQAPVFRGGVDRVAVDFLALAPDGGPISDLKPEEMSLKIDGKPRAIRSLEFVRLAPVDPPPPTSLPPALAVPAPFGSNALADAGRAIILVFHHTSLQPGEERLVKESVTAFVKALTPRDRVALITFQEGRVEVDLTTDHARVLKALPGISGHAPPPDGFIPATAAGAANETKFAVRNLISLMNSFAGIDGPKTVVFISGGLPASNDQGRDANAALMEYQDLGNAAARIGAQLFIIKPHSLNGMGVNVNHPTVGDDGLSNNGFTGSVGSGLEQFAGVTGGEFFQVATTATRIFERVNRASSAHYLLGFDADPSERNGKAHKIVLTSDRQGVTIRARPQFVIEKPNPKAAAAGPVSSKTLLNDLKTHRDLPLQAVANTFRSSAQGKVLVLVAAQSAQGTPLTSASFALIDAKGRIVTAWDADATDLAKSPVVSATTIISGAYRLRVAAGDADGRLGAVDYEFTAALTPAGPLTLGGLMLGHQRGEEFTPQFEFGNSIEATAYIEVYGRPTSEQTATITIELAATADGPAIVRVPAAITPTRQPDRWIATAPLQTGTLPHGDIVVRAVAKVGDAVVGTVIRTLRK